VLKPHQRTVLLVLFGRPESLNLRNLAWHGFLGRAPVPSALWVAGIMAAASTVQDGLSEAQQPSHTASCKTSWRFPIARGQPRLQHILEGNGDLCVALEQFASLDIASLQTAADRAETWSYTHPLAASTARLPALQRCIALCLNIEWRLRQVGRLPGERGGGVG
jgi:hypothetical protein